MGYIKKEFVEKILDLAILEEVISDFVSLKKEGANLKGLSPFSNEKTPSFVVSPSKNIWKDFSSGKGGNVLSFLTEKGYSFVQAIEYLAGKYGETVEYEKPELAEKKKVETTKKEELRKTLQATHNAYIKEYNNLPATHTARTEIEEKRRYTQEDILEWGIGFAPENFLYDKLYNSGKVDNGYSLGLIKKGNNNNKYDVYTNRVTYPLHDEFGQLIGLAGRKLSSNQKYAKWINPTVNEHNLLYKKSKVLFGIHKAKQAIRQQNECFLVEGYNDVIAFHKHEVPNTVAPCGTAITPNHLSILKRLCEKIVFCMDPDDAGTRAVLKQIPECLIKGLRVEVIVLPLDPDDFSRVYKDSIEKYGLENMLKEEGIRIDGFKFLMDNHIVGNAIDKSNAAKQLCELIAKIPDSSISDIYLPWLAKESGVKESTIKKWVKEILEKQEKADTEKKFDEYHFELPKGVDIPFDELLPQFKGYGMFQANNQIFFAMDVSADGKIRFHSISNFAIEVLQHMTDEKFPKKLIRVKNIHNENIIFDADSNSLNTLQKFDDTLTNHGNFRFDGNNKDLKILRRYLMDHMGNGQKIDVLGWQPDARIWVWNNAVINYDGSEINMDENGIIVHHNAHYYVPSANKIYANQSSRYISQKKFKKIETSIPLEAYLTKMKLVHREHAISAVLFSIGSLFQDFVVKNIGSFPLLFLYGPGSSGKDELAKIIQSFVGVPQTPINLAAGISTAKAQIRELAQFRNGISQFSEFKRDDQTEEMLKGLWDRNGYKKGNIESAISTDEVPVEASVVITGNEYPSKAPLIMRLISNEMTKNEFTKEETDHFDELSDMTSRGLSGYSHEILKQRIMFEEKFVSEYRKWKVILKQENPNAIGRMIGNYSVLGTVYTLFKDTISFPFTQEEMLNHFKACIDIQLRKINSSSITNRFWEMFVAGLRGHKDDRLQVGQVVSTEANYLYFNWRHTYNKVSRLWFMHYQEAAPSNTTLLEALDKANLIVSKKKHHDFSPGRTGVRSSALEISMEHLDETLKNDIVGSIMYQEIQVNKEMGQEVFSFPPATPNKENDIEEIDGLPY